MDWKDISSLLLRTSEFFNAHTQTRKTVADTLSRMLNTPISEESISIRGRVARLTAHPAIKNEVMLKQGSILESLKEKGVDIVKIC